MLSPAGNVGIGTTAPGEKVDISGNLRVQDNKYISFSHTDPDGYLIRNYFGTNDGYGSSNYGLNYLSAGHARIVYDTDGTAASGDVFEIRKGSGAGSTVLLADIDGNIGIGTDTPTEKLEVNGNIELQGDGEIKIASGGLIRFDD